MTGTKVRSVKRNRFCTLATAVGVLAALTACSGANYPDFDREKASEDDLPAVFSDEFDLDQYDLSTSRFEATHEGVDYYLIRTRGTSPSGVLECVAVAHPVLPSISCGAGGVTVAAPGFGEVQLVSALSPDHDEWTKISDNLLVPAER